MTSPLYHISDLRFFYDAEEAETPRCALAIDALRVAPKSILGIIGHNGSGKSTLLQLLAFIERPTEGEIRFEGAAVATEALRRRVSLLPQDAFLLKRTVFENIAYGLKVRNDAGRLRERVFSALETVALSPKAYAHRRWSALSGGEARRVALAARLVLQPEVLLLDEPISGVDAESALRIQEAVLHAREHWGTTLIIAAHDRDWLFDICDEVLFLFRGALLGKGEWNLVFGPWHRNGTGAYEKRLTGGQRLPMPEPPAPDAVALLSPERLRLYPGKTPAPEGFFHIDGTITRLALENATDRVSVSVSAGEITLTVRIESTGPENMNSASYRLGEAATIAYPPAAITWRR